MFTTRTSLPIAAIIAAGAGLGVTAQSAGAAALVPACGVSQLSARLTEGSPGAGQRYATLTLTNRSHITCRTGGYVGLGLESADRPLTTHVTRDRGPVRTLVLRPGARASTQLHWGAIPGGPGDNRTSPCVRAPTRVLVTPPNSYTSLTLAWREGIVCEGGAIDVTPLVLGG